MGGVIAMTKYIVHSPLHTMYILCTWRVHDYYGEEMNHLEFLEKESENYGSYDVILKADKIWLLKECRRLTDELSKAIKKLERYEAEEC